MYLWMVENLDTREIKIFSQREGALAFYFNNYLDGWKSMKKITVQEVEE